MAAMLHARNNTILFLWDKMFILMQNIFIVLPMQHGRHAKPLLLQKVAVCFSPQRNILKIVQRALLHSTNIFKSLKKLLCDIAVRFDGITESFLTIH